MSPQAQFLQRLLLRSRLTNDEQRAILALRGTTQRFQAHQDIVRPGEHVTSACLVARGLVARYDAMLCGRRQLTSFYLAGDACDLHSVVAPKASWSITAICDASVVRVPHEQLKQLCINYPQIALAFWRDGTVDASVFAQWIVNLGAKEARARIAHLFCEVGIRSEAAGLGSRTNFEFLATQSQIAEATGLTSVHVNRTLQELRGQGLLTFKAGRVCLDDWDALRAVGEFNSDYLMLGEPSRTARPRNQPGAIRRGAHRRYEAAYVGSAKSEPGN